MTPVCVLVLLLAGHVASLEFNSCGEEGVDPPNSLYIYGCRKQPCEFHLGNNVTGALNITVGEESFSLRAEMTVDHNGSLITFPVPGINVCDGLEKGKCQLDVGSSVNHYFLLHVNIDLPDEDMVTFKMVVKNDKGTSLSCCQFTGKIVGDAPAIGPDE